MLTAIWYRPLLYTHIICVLTSGSVFFIRGCLMLVGSGLANHVVVKRASYLVDTVLLAAGIGLTLVLHQYPFVQAWLTVKLLLLVVYIVLGVFALRRARTRVGRGLFFLAALAVFGFIISVAVTHNPWGAFIRLV